jgi:hypothetical protein
MLFGRFLIERNLLIHPRLGVPISRGDLKELAEEEGFADEWVLVERFAAPSLPAVFKPDDLVWALELDPHFQARLRALVTALPEEVFTADDSLGWTYQFWRGAEKKAVNDRQVKIGADELPAVTQLFTEPYMVKFLLHNTLGAWWAGKVLAAQLDLARAAPDENALRAACALPDVEWDYLRFVRDDEGDGPWRPAAGTFPGWPHSAAEITYLDPCCGSGHFLVEAFAILAALWQEEEDLSPEEARGIARQSTRARNRRPLRADRGVQRGARRVAPCRWSGEFAGAAHRLGRRAAAVAQVRVRRVGQWRRGTAAGSRSAARSVPAGAIAWEPDRIDGRRSGRPDPHRPPRSEHRSPGGKNARRRA